MERTTSDAERVVHQAIRIAQTSAADPIRLLIFGDSWASAEYGDIDTWPELLAERHFSGRVLNFAQPFAGSNNLDWQLKRLKMMLMASSQGGDGDILHPEALAIVHCGGNDLYHASPYSLAHVAAVSPCCGLVLPPLAKALAANLQSFVEGLIELRVCRVALAGVPLTAHVPMIAAPAQKLPFPNLGAAAIGLVMRGCNTVLLAAMRAGLEDAQRASGVSLEVGVCVDEASAINAVCARSSRRGEQLGKHSSSDPMWYDISHPSQALHTALADELHAQLSGALPSALALKADAGDREALWESETSGLLPTPTQRAAMGR